jgi:putative ubiquitin-RnfH superfamily antitoxin RatB of RatAB toxin-antitoxin module
MVNEADLIVTVVFSPTPREVVEITLHLDAPCTLLQALQRSGLLTRFPALDSLQTVVGIWGRKARWNQLLRGNDRVEVFRPLLVDPKVARRQRFVKQGSRGAGLFEKKRTGAKASY